MSARCSRPLYSTGCLTIIYQWAARVYTHLEMKQEELFMCHFLYDKHYMNVTLRLICILFQHYWFTPIDICAVLKIHKLHCAATPQTLWLDLLQSNGISSAWKISVKHLQQMLYVALTRCKNTKSGFMADSRLALCNNVSHWLGASLKSALSYMIPGSKGSIPNTKEYVACHTQYSADILPFIMQYGIRNKMMNTITDFSSMWMDGHIDHIKICNPLNAVHNPTDYQNWIWSSLYLEMSTTRHLMPKLEWIFKKVFTEETPLFK